MTPFRFIHSSDLHLGRRFAALPEDIRPRLVEARHGALARLAQAARDHGARDILLAGDVFDSPTPSARVRAQALSAMGAAADLVWWILPGNHDSLAAEELWSEVARGPANLRLLAEAAPVELAPGAWLLPAPLPRRFPGIDLTAAMPAAATPDGALRIGLAHGAVQSFDEDGARRDEVIPPDRARSAGLAYLALGDWHGAKAITPDTWYSGSPERDGFRHEGRGACLAVTLSAGAPPQVQEVDTGTFHWTDSALPLLPGQDAAAGLAAALPADRALRRDHVLRLRAEGRVTLAARAALMAAAARVAPEFGYFELTTEALGLEHEATDLDAIDRAGALRLAADRLSAQAEDAALAERDRAVARAALNRLYGLLLEDQP